MGMFDSLYDKSGREWQTKAYANRLDRFDIGDMIDAEDASYQAEVLGGVAGKSVYSLATVESGRLVAVPAERNPAMRLRNYYGHDITDQTIGGGE